MSSRHAQCSTITPSTTRQMWMNVHAVGRPDVGVSASSGIVDARWVPCSVRCCATRSPSPMRWCLFDRDRPEVVVDDAQDELQTVATLGTSRVVHHVRGGEIVDGGVVGCEGP
jgi:hypothetical protein